MQHPQTKKRPSTTYMEMVQNDVNPNMRSILVDWLVEVAQEYNMQPDTLYLTVAYIDRFLSSVAVARHELQLVGIACMLVAAKYEEIYAPTVQDFVYITDHSYTAEQLLAMEHKVLETLQYEVRSALCCVWCFSTGCIYVLLRMLVHTLIDCRWRAQHPIRFCGGFCGRRWQSACPTGAWTPWRTTYWS